MKLCLYGIVCDLGTPAKEDLIKAYPFHMNQENKVQNISTKTTKKHVQPLIAIIKFQTVTKYRFITVLKVFVFSIENTLKYHHNNAKQITR